MRIHDLRSAIDGGEKVVSARLDDFLLWYRMPSDCSTGNLADAFVAAGLMVAMKRGEDIYVDEQWPVSSRLLHGLSEVQNIYSLWFEDFTKISVHASTTESKSEKRGCASFFSGGVDSLFTFYTRLPMLSHAIFLGGIDMQLENTQLYEETLEKNTTFCSRHGVTLIPVTTNIRQLCHPAGISWGNRFSGPGLASIALLLNFPYTLVPASQSYTSLYPDGTSPLTDHLFSSEATSIYYDGGFARPHKIQFLGAYPEALELLRVCWQDNGYNCGECEKCLRTRLILKILGLKSPTLADLSDLRVLGDWRIESDAQKVIMKSILSYVDRQKQADIYRFLRRIQRREHLKRSLADLDRNLLGGAMKRTFKAIKGA